MTTLPKWIYFNGTAYYLKEWQAVEDERLKGWWFCAYYPDGDMDKMPPEVTDGNNCYFLVSSDPYSYEEAAAELLEKVNNMKPWLKV